MSLSTAPDRGRARASLAAPLVLAAGCTLSFDASRLDMNRCDSPEPRPELPSEPTLYVAPDGSDDADGTQDAPLATLQAAAEVVEPGDLVLVRAGAYVGFDLSRSGTEDAPIVFRSDGARIERPNGSGSGIRLLDTSHVWIEGFAIDGGAESFADAGIRQAAPDAPARGFVLRDNVVTGARRGIGLENARDALVVRNEVHDHETHGISLGGSLSRATAIRGNVVYTTALTGIFVEGEDEADAGSLVTGITIDGNEVYDTGDAIAIDGIHDSVVQNNVLHGFGRDGIRIYASGSLSSPSGLTVVNNTVHGRRGTDGACIQVMQGGNGNVAFNNVFVHAGDGSAVHLWSTEGVSFDFDVVGGGFVLEEAGASVALGAWRDAGFGARTVEATAEQLFVDALAADYALRDGAPAIDAGAASFEEREAPSRDGAGHGRPAGDGFDVGAYERDGKPVCP